MDWIKKNYDRFALLLLAVALLTSSAYIIWLTCGFSDRFAPVRAEVVHGKKLTSLETEALKRAEASLEKPASWESQSAYLYVSRKFIVQQDASGQKSLINPFQAGSKPVHPPVPNEWFLQHGLEDRILDGDVLDQDPDKDGFTNLDEYLGKTDPQDPAVHPAYLTKLRLKQYIKRSFRLRFEAYDDDSFQINTVDVKQPSQFVKLGEVIAGTKFKVVKFEKKSVFNKSIEMDSDVSELTVEHIETGLKVPLVVRTETDIPDHYARFAFLWDHSEFSVKKDQKFFLKPEPDIEYKLIDIHPTEAVIVNVKTEGDPIKVPHLE